MRVMAYLDGYKEAGVAEIAANAALAGGKASGELALTVIPYLLLAPWIVGGGAGLLHSRLTSPSPTDRESVQQALEASELDEFQAELERRRKQSLLEGENKGKVPNERSLHI